ncbi:MAG: VOC family protein [Patescibacteria group bacterium]
MIDHVSLNVSNLEKSRDFYREALKPLGYTVVLDIADIESWGLGIKGCSIGENNETRLWLSGDDAVAKCHIAFCAKSEEEVKSFHEAGIKAGGKDNGAPGPRPDYGEHYYGAFVIDPDGNNIEVVFRG